jgi:hypothetical protein
VPFEIIRERIENLSSNYLSYWLLIPLIFTGCIGTKNLNEGEQLLSRQRIKGNKNVESESLAEQYQQQPNRKVLKVFPISLYTWMYQTGENKCDSAKIDM